MTNGLVVTITDELVAEIESACERRHSYPHESILALLSERAELKRDAERWRYARDILTIEAIELAQSEFIQFGLPPSEAESIRADQAIDQAMQERQK